MADVPERMKTHDLSAFLTTTPTVGAALVKFVASPGNRLDIDEAIDLAGNAFFRALIDQAGADDAYVRREVIEDVEASMPVDGLGDAIFALYATHYRIGDPQQRRALVDAINARRHLFIVDDDDDDDDEDGGGVQERYEGEEDDFLHGKYGEEEFEPPKKDDEVKDDEVKDDEVKDDELSEYEQAESFGDSSIEEDDTEARFDDDDDDDEVPSIDFEQELESDIDDDDENDDTQTLDAGDQDASMAYYIDVLVAPTIHTHAESTKSIVLDLKAAVLFGSQGADLVRDTMLATGEFDVPNAKRVVADMEQRSEERGIDQERRDLIVRVLVQGGRDWLARVTRLDVRARPLHVDVPTLALGDRLDSIYNDLVGASSQYAYDEMQRVLVQAIIPSNAPSAERLAYYEIVRGYVRIRYPNLLVLSAREIAAGTPSLSVGNAKLLGAFDRMRKATTMRTSRLLPTTDLEALATHVRTDDDDGDEDVDDDDDEQLKRRRRRDTFEPLLESLVLLLQYGGQDWLQLAVTHYDDKAQAAYEALGKLSQLPELTKMGRALDQEYASRKTQAEAYQDMQETVFHALSRRDASEATAHTEALYNRIARFVRVRYPALILPLYSWDGDATKLPQMSDDGSGQFRPDTHVLQQFGNERLSVVRSLQRDKGRQATETDLEKIGADYDLFSSVQVPTATTTTTKEAPQKRYPKRKTKATESGKQSRARLRDAPPGTALPRRLTAKDITAYLAATKFDAIQPPLVLLTVEQDKEQVDTMDIGFYSQQTQSFEEAARIERAPVIAEQLQPPSLESVMALFPEATAENDRLWQDLVALHYHRVFYWVAAYGLLRKARKSDEPADAKLVLNSVVIDHVDNLTEKVAGVTQKARERLSSDRRLQRLENAGSAVRDVLMVERALGESARPVKARVKEIIRMSRAALAEKVKQQLKVYRTNAHLVDLDIDEAVADMVKRGELTDATLLAKLRAMYEQRSITNRSIAGRGTYSRMYVVDVMEATPSYPFNRYPISYTMFTRFVYWIDLITALQWSNVKVKQMFIAFMQIGGQRASPVIKEHLVGFSPDDMTIIKHYLQDYVSHGEQRPPVDESIDDAQVLARVLAFLDYFEFRNLVETGLEGIAAINNALRRGGALSDVDAARRLVKYSSALKSYFLTLEQKYIRQIEEGLAMREEGESTAVGDITLLMTDVTEDDALRKRLDKELARVKKRVRAGRSRRDEDAQGMTHKEFRQAVVRQSRIVESGRKVDGIKWVLDLLDRRMRSAPSGDTSLAWLRLKGPERTLSQPVWDPVTIHRLALLAVPFVGVSPPVAFEGVPGYLAKAEIFADGPPHPLTFVPQQSNTGAPFRTLLYALKCSWVLPEQAFGRVFRFIDPDVRVASELIEIVDQHELLMQRASVENLPENVTLGDQLHAKLEDEGAEGAFPHIFGHPAVGGALGSLRSRAEYARESNPRAFRRFLVAPDGGSGLIDTLDIEPARARRTIERSMYIEGKFAKFSLHYGELILFAYANAFRLHKINGWVEKYRAFIRNPKQEPRADADVEFATRSQRALELIHGLLDAHGQDIPMLLSTVGEPQMATPLRDAYRYYVKIGRLPEMVGGTAPGATQLLIGILHVASAGDYRIPTYISFDPSVDYFVRGLMQGGKPFRASRSTFGHADRMEIAKKFGRDDPWNSEPVRIYAQNAMAVHKRYTQSPSDWTEILGRKVNRNERYTNGELARVPAPNGQWQAMAHPHQLLSVYGLVLDNMSEQLFYDIVMWWIEDGTAPACADLEATPAEKRRFEFHTAQALCWWGLGGWRHDNFVIRTLEENPSPPDVLARFGIAMGREMQAKQVERVQRALKWLEQLVDYYMRDTTSPEVLARASNTRMWPTSEEDLYGVSGPLAEPRVIPLSPWYILLYAPKVFLDKHRINPFSRRPTTPAAETRTSTTTTTTTTFKRAQDKDFAKRMERYFLLIRQRWQIEALNLQLRDESDDDNRKYELADARIESERAEMNKVAAEARAVALFIRDARLNPSEVDVDTLIAPIVQMRKTSQRLDLLIKHHRDYADERQRRKQQLPRNILFHNFTDEDIAAMSEWYDDEWSAYVEMMLNLCGASLRFLQELIDDRALSSSLPADADASALRQDRRFLFSLQHQYWLEMYNALTRLVREVHPAWADTFRLKDPAVIDQDLTPQRVLDHITHQTDAPTNVDIERLRALHTELQRMLEIFDA